MAGNSHPRATIGAPRASARDQPPGDGLKMKCRVVRNQKQVLDEIAFFDYDQVGGQIDNSEMVVPCSLRRCGAVNVSGYVDGRGRPRCRRGRAGVPTGIVNPTHFVLHHHLQSHVHVKRWLLHNGVWRPEGLWRPSGNARTKSMTTTTTTTQIRPQLLHCPWQRRRSAEAAA